MGKIETQLYRRCDLVDILSARSAGENELLAQFPAGEDDVFIDVEWIARHASAFHQTYSTKGRF